ncbi:Cobalamin synthase [Salinivirga cyanobacteriivorans]|uniref:Adenosylcobinamide-GDP ribazoletransferase n=1 Tax=Salinivirga cyanobacteriivorans TaxID=1307839 RepID=A0A0S2I4R7_9BACT|nr:adenosylcobinamide-GDP ribazoletransferase [Salinivirga cyanobacteriivorans]ALO17343.1 Cobalamin synthase [Salinivirga cyanobacteriivorans]
MIKREFKILLTAITFFTRIPVYKYADFSKGALNKSSRYFTLVGYIVGGFAALVFYLSNMIFSVSISVILSTGASILLTGAFHEDAIADVFDGFGGGWEKQRILDIMKDSRVGAFGAVGLIMVLITKIMASVEIPVHYIPISIFTAHAISRFSSTLMIYTHEYVRENDDAKAKPMAKSIGTGSIIFSFVLATLPITLFCNYWLFLAIIPVWLTKVFMARYFKKWIGGYTGDCLGAIQQISEVVFYLSVLALINIFVVV